MDKPYPRTCGECQQDSVVRVLLPKQSMPVLVAPGRLRILAVENLPVDRCERCGEVWYTNVTDDYITKAMDQWKDDHEND